MALITRSTSKYFTRTLMSPMLEKITLLKRGDDQAEGSITVYTVFQCRRSLITKTGEPLVGDVLVDHRCIWHIPRREMDRIGVPFLTPADQIVDHLGRTWQPESPEMISDKLMETEYDVQCVRVPPTV